MCREVEAWELAPNTADALEIYDRICKALLRSDMTISEIIQYVTECAAELIRAEVGAYFSNAQAADQEAVWEVAALVGVERAGFEVSAPWITPFFVPAYEESKTVRSDDLSTDIRVGQWAEGHLPFRSYLAVAIPRRGGGSQGALLFGHDRIGAFTSHSELLIEKIASLAAVAIDNAERNERSRQEIEDRKRAESRFRSLIEYAPRMKWFRQGDNEDEYYNQAWHEWTGISRKHANAPLWNSTIHPDDLWYMDKIRNPSVAQGVPYTAEIRFRHRSGQYRYLSLSCSPLFEDGKIIGWTGTATDVHDLRETMQKAEEARAILRSVIDSATDLIYVKDIDGRFIVANHILETLVGRSLVGLTDYDITTAEEADVYAENDRVIRETGQAMVFNELLTAANGLTGVYQSSKMPWTSNGVVMGVVGISRNITERQRSEETRKLLLDELNHRVKNTLATIQSIASQTLRLTPDPEAFKVAFMGRLQAVSLTHNILTQGNWSSASLSSIVEAELSPYHGPESGRWTISGEDVSLSPTASSNIGMVLHELATNAVKYGSLSNDGTGTLDLHWYVEDDRFRMIWSESGGPPVVPPTREGFGTRLFKNIARSFNGRVAFSYDPSGLVCAFEVPLAEIVSGPETFLKP